MGVFDYLRGLGWGDTAQPMPALGQDEIQQQSPALARLGTAPTMQSTGADVPVNTPLGQTILPHVAQGLADAVMAPGRAYNGQMAVRDPQSGELTQEATDWGAGTALGMLGASSVPRVAVAPGEAVVGSGPIRAYHGSPVAQTLTELRPSQGGELGPGFYFSKDTDVAKGYARGRGDEAAPNAGIVAVDINAPIKEISRKDWVSRRAHLYDEEQAKNGGNWSSDVARSAEQRLNDEFKQQGYAGIYDDTRQGVIFPDRMDALSIAEVLKKYGVASLAALPPGVLASMGLGSNGEPQAAPQQ